MKTADKLKIEYWPIDKLIPYGRNPRINDSQVDRMAGVIKEFGFRLPVLAKSDGSIIWVSFEPVIIPEQSLNLIENTLSFVDQYKLGKWNHDPRAEKIDWTSYTGKAADILRANGKQFYVKEDLRKYITGLSPREVDMDYMSLTANESQGKLF